MRLFGIQGPWNSDQRFTLKELLEEVDLTDEEVDDIASLRPQCCIELEEPAHESIPNYNNIVIRRVQ